MSYEIRTTMEDQFSAFKRNVELNLRLEVIGWGLFFIMIGVLWFLPEGLVPEGTWLAGVGLILLSQNLARYLFGIKVSTFFTIVGAITLVSGLGEALLSVELFFPLVFLSIGAVIIYSIFDKKEVESEDPFLEMVEWCFESEDSSA
ncbi:MAG: hypothetical protein GTO18_06880 [Anaerolineales bacterium]|nr:hypothetical protein [Anaerolineales bacterium]